MNIAWDAKKYTADFSFVPQYGNRLIDLIDMNTACTLLDLGCGNGVLTKALQDKGLSVTGLDASKELLAIAKKIYPEIPFLYGTAENFQLPQPVDVVFSNAVFHWIDRDKQADMLNCVYRALKQGGQFVFEFGGKGNNRLIHQALEGVFSEHGYSYQMPFYFPSVGEYASLVEQAGFCVKYALLFDRPTLLKGDGGLTDWIHMFVKTPFSVVPTKAEQEEIIKQAAERLRSSLYQQGSWHADYVRIQMKAVKG